MIYILISILYIFILVIYIIIYKYNNDVLLVQNIYKKQLYVPLLNNDMDFQDL